MIVKKTRIPKQTSDEGSKGESAISLLVAVAQTRAALPVLACDSEINKAESEDERKHRKQSDE